MDGTVNTQKRDSTKCVLPPAASTAAPPRLVKQPVCCLIDGLFVFVPVDQVVCAAHGFYGDLANQRFQDLH